MLCHISMDMNFNSQLPQICLVMFGLWNVLVVLSWHVHIETLLQRVQTKRQIICEMYKIAYFVPLSLVPLPTYFIWWMQLYVLRKTEVQSTACHWISDSNLITSSLPSNERFRGHGSHQEKSPARCQWEVQWRGGAACTVGESMVRRCYVTGRNRQFS